MKAQRSDTDGLWRLLHTLIAIMVFSVFCVAAYLPLQPIITTHLDKEKRSAEDIALYIKKRSQVRAEDTERIEEGVHLQTGLVYAAGFEEVRAACLSCHSAKLITQNRADSEGWLQMIRWMQKTQGLNDLGSHESTIVDYLATHYGAKEMGRRPPLDIAAIEWYILDLAPAQ